MCYIQSVVSNCIAHARAPVNPESILGNTQFRITNPLFLTILWRGTWDGGGGPTQTRESLYELYSQTL